MDEAKAVVSIVYPTTHFGFRKITVERPLRLNFQASPSVSHGSRDDGSRPPGPAGSGGPEVVLLREVIGITVFIANAPNGWPVHRLSGDRRVQWSVSVSGNWRIPSTK